VRELFGSPFIWVPGKGFFLPTPSDRCTPGSSRGGEASGCSGPTEVRWEAKEYLLKKQRQAEPEGGGEKSAGKSACLYEGENHGPKKRALSQGIERRGKERKMTIGVIRKAEERKQVTID